MPHRAATDPRGRVVAQIRARRALGLTRNRRRMPRQQQPDAIRLSYFGELRPIVGAAARLVERWLLPALPSILPDMRRDADMGKAVSAAINRGRLRAVMDDIRRHAEGMIQQRPTEDLARRFAERTDDFQRTQLRRQLMSQLGVDLTALEPSTRGRIDSFVAENVSLIRSLPEEYFDDIEQCVIRGAELGLRHEELAADLRERYDVAESRAALIARDQVGKLFGQVNQDRQEALGIDSFIWRTAHDDRVREEHAALDGETFQWDALPAEGRPGEAINCRCSADPDVSGLLERLEAG